MSLNHPLIESSILSDSHRLSSKIIIFDTDISRSKRKIFISAETQSVSQESVMAIIPVRALDGRSIDQADDT